LSFVPIPETDLSVDVLKIGITLYISTLIISMAYAAGQGTMTGDKKLIDPLIADLITLSYECKRKYPPIKEVC